jgi:hypothetical protein
MTSPRPESPEIHAPQPSVWPFTLAVGVSLIAAGVLTTVAISGIGLGIVFIALAGWTQENRIQASRED